MPCLYIRESHTAKTPPSQNFRENKRESINKRAISCNYQDEVIKKEKTDVQRGKILRTKNKQEKNSTKFNIIHLSWNPWIQMNTNQKLWQQKKGLPRYYILYKFLLIAKIKKEN